MKATSPTPLTLNEATRLLDRYGPDLTQWPSDKAAALKALTARSIPAQRLWSQAKALELQLKADAAPLPTPALRARIIAAVSSSSEQYRPVSETRNEYIGTALERFSTQLLSWLSQALWRPALIACVPLAFGYLLGINLQPDMDTDSATDTADYMTLLSWQDTLEELLTDES